MVFWDGANLYFATDGSSMVPDDISSIGVTYGGTGYGSNPGVEFMGGGGTGAAATATVSGGVITGVKITNPVCPTRQLSLFASYSLAVFSSP